ncbi:hypothetical protein E7811_17610 [Aliigemmobacter aestuarii]|uniref:ATP-grasp domain-containing protein n=1 Tax=Aliigemmobacter aestuarii TaxID=1445661 RepID=A0A4V3V008_9RHOB|nr:hypothetical protein [Gemmobacter aestuarii]THD80844.1 hypothetical protein E7811_17610 [Gemmobacter aestuarii]
MILYVCRARHRYTIDRFLPTLPPESRGVLDVLSYEQIFSTLSLPPAHLVFTDFDRLSQYELEIAATAAEQMRAANPDVRILNHPARFLQRHELLERLWHEGINPFRSARLELPLPDLAFPVFLRREGDAQGAETGLLHDRAALDLAVQDMMARGIPLRGRLAVEFCNRADADGMYRKYGAFRVGDRILPQHLQISEDWVVKSNSSHRTERHIAEEMDYILTNPHEDVLLRIMDLASADFGRIDYTVLDGKVIVFEINSNPTFPGIDKDDPRQERRRIVRDRLLAAFQRIDTPLAEGKPVTLGLPYPRSHDLPAPVKAAPPVALAIAPTAPVAETPVPPKSGQPARQATPSVSDSPTFLRRIIRNGRSLFRGR